MSFEYKVVSSMEKVFASGENTKELVNKQLTGLKGEILSFQIAYYWGGERKERGFVEVDSPLGKAVNVREVKLVPCEYPCHMKRDEGYLATEPGLYPDLLTEISQYGFSLVSGQWRSLWVDIEIAEDMVAETYPVKIVMKKQDEVLGEVNMECEVVDMVLPKLPIPHTEWFHCDCLSNYYNVEIFSEEHWGIIEEFVKAAVKYKCNMLLTPVFTPPLDTGVGLERPTVQLVDVSVTEEGYEFEFSKFYRWVEMARRCGIEYFEISHLFSQWGAYATPKVMGMKDGKYQRLFGWETEASGTDYKKFIHEFLTALKTELVKLGINDKTYFHISDEPNMEQFESYQKALEVVREDLKDYPIIDALSDFEFYKKGLVKEPICGLDHIQPFLDCNPRPAKLWGYYCTAQCQEVTNRFVVLPGFRERILGTQMYKFQLDGFLHWGYNYYNSEYSLYTIDPYMCNDSSGAFPSGDPFLVYPGKGGKPEGSLRLMLMDEALSDYCAMIALEKLVGRDEVMKLIEKDALIEIKKYPQSSEWILNMRERINQRIKKEMKN